jgi:hypothetical protein
MTGTITIETMNVGKSHFGQANPNNAQATLTKVHGMELSPHSGDFSGAADSTDLDLLTSNNTKKLNNIISGVRKGKPEYVKLGDKDSILEDNLIIYGELLPFLFKSEDHAVRKYYFSDDPQAQNSDKYINFYFDVTSDSDIDRDDFCEARIFDPENDLYVSGYVDCIKPELQNVDIYDQTDEDFGEPC